MGWRASEPSPPAGSRPSEGLPSCSAAMQASRAACPCCLGRVQHRMGIYLNKGAKVGCSSQNRASSGKVGPGTLGLNKNQAAGNTVALEPLDSVQICSNMKVWRRRGSLRSSSAVGEALSPAQRSLQKPEGAGVRGGGFEGCPRALGLGAGPREKLGWRMQEPVKSEVSVDLSWGTPVLLVIPPLPPRDGHPSHPRVSGGSGASALSPQGKKDIYEINGNLCK